MCIVSFERNKHFMLWNELAKHPLKSKRRIFEELALEDSQDKIDSMIIGHYGCYACKYAAQKTYVDTNGADCERNCIKNCPLDFNRQKIDDFILKKWKINDSYEYTDGDYCLGGLFEEFIDAIRDAQSSIYEFNNSVREGKPDFICKIQYKNYCKKASQIAKMIRDLPVRDGVQVK